MVINNFNNKTNRSNFYHRPAFLLCTHNIGLNKYRLFSQSSLRLTEDDNSDNDSILSEFSDASISSNKSDLIRKIEKLDDRLANSQNVSRKICEEVKYTNRYLKKYIDANKGRLSVKDRDQLESVSAKARSKHGSMVDAWEGKADHPHEMHENTSVSGFAALYTSFAKSFLEKGFTDKSSGVAENIKESKRLTKDLNANSNNLIKDNENLHSLKSKLEDVNKRNSGSLLDDFADTSAQMPSYMDPED